MVQLTKLPDVERQLEHAVSELRNLNEEQNNFGSQLEARLKNDHETDLTSNPKSGLHQADLQTAGQAAPEIERPTEQSIQESSQVSLAHAVEMAVSNYMTAMKDQVSDQELTDLYDILMQEVEAPLLTVVMRSTTYNQSKTAKILGLNRGTLRKKLKRYDLL